MARELSTAERIVKGAVARAQEMGVRLSIAVVDEKNRLTGIVTKSSVLSSLI